MHTGSFSNSGSHEIPNLTAGTQYSIRVGGATGRGPESTILTETKATSRFLKFLTICYRYISCTVGAGYMVNNFYGRTIVTLAQTSMFINIICL